MTFALAGASWRGDLLISLGGVRAQPRFEFGEPHLSAFVEAGEEQKRGGVIEFQTVAVDLQKGCGDCDGYPLVAIDEWMILGQAFPERGSLLNQVAVITGLRSGQRGFEAPRSRMPREPPNLAINRA